jgi:hypothetical protein
MQISRKLFLQRAGSTVLLVTAGGSILSLIDCGGSPLARNLRFSNLDEALAEIEKIQKASSVSSNGVWNPSQVFAHLAQSIDYSISGYPENKPAFFRKTIGRIVLRKFLGAGQMSHGLADAIPGAPALDPGLSLTDAAARLKSSIAAFRAHQAELAIHFVYDAVTKAEYEQVHAMHIANHLSAFSYS